MTFWRTCFFLCVLVPIPLVGAVAAPAQEAKWNQLDEQALKLDKEGKYEQALQAAAEALKVAQATYGQDDFHVSLTLGYLGQIFSDAGDYKNAEPAYERALAIDEKSSGPESTDVASDLGDLGTLYFHEKRYAKAEPLFARALKLDQKGHGPESAEVGTDLANLGLSIEYQARYAEAEPLLEHALAIDEKKRGADAPDVGLDLINVGELYVDEGKYAQAKLLYQRALRIMEHAFGPDSTNDSMVLSKLGRTDDHLGKYAEAEPLLERALRIDEKASGADSTDVATDLNYLARVYAHRGRYGDAQPLYERALKIDEKVEGSDDPDVAAILEDLGTVDYRQDKYADAEPLYQRALKIEEKTHGAEHPDVAAALNDLGILYDSMGRYADAEALYRRALGIQEKAEGADHPDVATTLYNLATLFFHQGKYAEAEPLYQRELKIKEHVLGTDDPALSTDVNNLAALYYRQGKYAEAEQLYERALSIDVKALGPDDPGDATDLNNLALVYQHEGKLADAQSLLERALAIDEKGLGPDRQEVAMCLNNLATVDIARAKYSDAEPLIARAVKIDEKALGPDHPEVATDLNSLAVVYSKEGRYADAEPVFQRILAIHEKILGPDHPDLATDLTNFGLLYEYQNKYAQAEPLFQRAFSNLFQQFQYEFAYMTEKERLGFLDTVAEDFPAYFSFVHRFHDKDPELIGSMYNLLLWEKGFVAGSVADMRRQIEVSGDAESLKLLNELTEKRTQIATLLNQQPQDREAWRKQVDQLRADADETEKALVARSSTFAERRKLERATWQQVRDGLKPGDAAVEFAHFRYYETDWTDKSYYVALVITHETKDEPEYVFLGTDAEIEGDAITHFQQQLRTRGVVAEQTAAALPGQGAYAAIWKPLEPALSDVKRVYLAPDGVLNQLPLGIIPSADGALEMEKYDLRVVSSTRDILRTPPAHGAETALLVGNPLFSLTEEQQHVALEKIAAARPESHTEPTAAEGELSRDGGSGAALPPLPGTGAEVDAIAQLMQQRQWKTEIYTGDRALKSVVEEASSPRVVHLATHGFFLPDQQIKNSEFMNAQLDENASDDPTMGREDPMLRSGLYFAGADRTLQGKSTAKGLDNGVLTALETGNLNLEGTELVVLSACNTGQGDVKNGEGVFGLRRALQEAGASEVLMSLWSVPDQETLELMKQFYANWLGGMEVHESLRRAQLDMREKVKTAHDGRDLPFYWGAFVLVGP